MSGTEETVIQFCCGAPYCGKVYYSRFTLKRHVEVTHMKKRQAICPECGHTFATKQNLREHLHLHSVLKTFHCDLCGKQFKQGSQLSLHKRKHANGEISDTDAQEKDERQVEIRGNEEGNRLPLADLLVQATNKRRKR